MIRIESGPPHDVQNIDRGLRRVGAYPHAQETDQMDCNAYLGLDVHKNAIAVAIADAGRTGDGARDAPVSQPTLPLPAAAAAVLQPAPTLPAAAPAVAAAVPARFVAIGCFYFCVVIIIIQHFLI